MEPFGFVLILAGLFPIVAALFDWDWFMESRKARIWTALFGRNGARIFYMITGSIIIVLGVLMGLGVID